MLGITHRLATLLGVCLLCAGCGSDPTPKVDPTPTTTTPAVTIAPPTTATPTATPIVDTPQGVVKRWIQAYNILQETGDGSDLIALSPQCKSCRDVAKDIGGIYANGGHVDGGTWHLHHIELHGSSGGLVGIRCHIVSETTRYTRRAGGPITTLPGGPFDMEFDAKQFAGHWVVDYQAEVAS